MRFPLLTSQLERHRPKLLIATGMSHLQDFLYVTKSKSSKEHVFKINDSKKRMFVSTDGLVPLVVLPHLSGGSNGLNSNAAVAHAAQVHDLLAGEGLARPAQPAQAWRNVSGQNHHIHARINAGSELGGFEVKV